MSDLPLKCGYPDCYDCRGTGCHMNCGPSPLHEAIARLRSTGCIVRRVEEPPSLLANLWFVDQRELTAGQVVDLAERIMP